MQTTEIRPILDAADVQIVFSVKLAQQTIWPAIDACAAHSRLLATGYATVEQQQLVARARALIQSEPSTLSELERERAHKLLLFQSQPFFVAEPFTAHPAEYVALAESVRTFSEIITGNHDKTLAEELRFIGRILG